MPLPPTWIEEFVQQLSYCLFPHEVPAPLGCHSHYESGCWEIALFPALRKSSRQGAYEEISRPSAFSFDIQQALPLFEELQHLDWITIPITHENEAGPHLLIEGVVEGQPVLIRICSEVPLRFQHDQDLIVQER